MATAIAEQILGVLVFVGTAAVLIACLVLFAECLAALFARTGRPESWGDRPRPAVAVLVPAHNEELVIQQTLKSLLPQVTEQDRLVVVADNCSDRTAAVARESGAEVLERQDLQRRGKGYALAFGVAGMRQAPPEVVIIIDADCHAHEGLVDTLVATVVSTGRPAQGIYLIESPADPSPRDSISAFAFVVKNHVRPMGLFGLGGTCLLTGAGMGLPWASIRDVDLATGNIVEDMQLGIDLAKQGHAPVLCPAARVTSTLPSQATAATSQHTRWEQGQLRTMLTNVSHLAFLAIWRRDRRLLWLALDLCIPPLSFLVFSWLAIFVLDLCVGLWTNWWDPLLIAVAAGGLLVTAIATAWWRFGREVCSFRVLCSLPRYVLWKIPIYLAFFFRPQKQWVRTARDGTESAKDPPGDNVGR